MSGLRTLSAVCRVFELNGQFEGTVMREACQAEGDANLGLHDDLRLFPEVLLGAIAGFAGGLAEVFWIGLYSLVEHRNGFDVARQVADTVLRGVTMPCEPTLGLGIHFTLSISLGIALVRPLLALKRRIALALAPISIGLLGLIWAVNFLLILPVLNPVFPLLLPAWVTIVSKVMFGITFAAVLCLGAESPHPYRILRRGGSPAAEQTGRRKIPLMVCNL